MTRPARPGDNVFNFLTTTWFNETTRVVQNSGTQPKLGEEQHDHCLCYLDEAAPNELKAHEPAILNDTFIVPAAAVADPARSIKCIKVKKPASGNTQKPWGVVQGPVYAERQGRIAVAGVTWAKFTRTDANHQFVDLDETTFALTSKTSGPARIISFTATSGNEGYGLILLASESKEVTAIFKAPAGGVPARNGTTPGTASAEKVKIETDLFGTSLTPQATFEDVFNVSDSQIEAGAYFPAVMVDDHWIAISGAATKFTFFQLDAGQSLLGTFGGTATAKQGWNGSGAALTVVNSGFWTSGQARGMAVWTENAWHIIWIQQPATRVLVKLRASPHDTPGAPRYGADPRDPDDKAYFETTTPPPEILSQFPNNLLYGLSTGECSNAFLLTGEAGDFGLLEWRQNTQTYVLTQVIEQRPQSFWGVLTADHPGGLNADVSMTLDTPIGPGYIGGTVVAKDYFNYAINAKSALPAHRALVQWDRKQQKYVIVAAQHQCTHFRGTIYASWSTLVLTFQVTPTYGFDGPIPSGPVTVQNIYSWETGTVGNEIKVEWDPINKYWIPTQLEWSCPTS